MGVGSMSITGLIASDVDIQAIITQLAQIKRRPVQLLEDHKSTCNERLAAFQQLTARVLSLSTYAADMSDGTAFAQVTASSSDESVVVASVSAGAPVGRYDITVSQLAQSHKVSSASVSSTSDALGYEGDIIVNGQVVSLEASDSLADIRDAINAAGAGASASILTVSDTDHRLTISSLTSGAEGALEVVDANASGILEDLGVKAAGTSVKHPITDGAASDSLTDKLSAVGDVLGLTAAPSGTVQVNGTDVAIDLSTDSLEEIASAIDAVAGVSATVETVSVDGEAAYRVEIVGDSGQPTFTDDSNVLATLGVLQKDFANEVDAAQDASLTIDGVSMTRATNAIDDAIENLQLQLVDSTAEAVTVFVARNTSASVSAMNSFVSAYNGVIDFINQHQDFDTEAETGGLFFGSPAVLNLEADLRDQVADLVDTMGGDLKLASQIGLSFDADDRLLFDSTQLLDALESDPEGIKRLFGVRTDATSAEVEVYEYTLATRDSGASGWAVEVTQIATRPTATSAALSGGIAVDETLTVNGKPVTLTAGMSLQEAADTLNALFNAQNMDMGASVDGDTIVIEHDLYGDSHEIDIESSLDDGSGGTDLGGATAGEIATYTGQDVAGSIDGEAATGSGRLLTAGEGTDAEGLRLRVTAEATGSKGVVLVSKGIAARLSHFVDAVTDADTGSLTRAAGGVSTEIESIDEEIAELEADVDRYIEQLQLDFARMETKMSQSVTLLDWMENQVEYLWWSGGRRS
ncbi:MAG: flagellar filament capping protein FliD [Armatimonadota bacterium]|nr:flagellar filament capping protein FliD [Armatimonadota bacterium]